MDPFKFLNPKSRQLADPCPRFGQRPDESPIAGRNLGRDLLDLLVGQRVWLPLDPDSWHRDPIGRVDGSPPLPNRDGEQLVDDLLDLSPGIE
jgi:hypothetical protein